MKKENVTTINTKTHTTVAVAPDRSDCVEMASAEVFAIPALVEALAANAAHGPISDAVDLLFVDKAGSQPRLMMSSARARTAEYSAVYWFIVGWSESCNAMIKKIKSLPNPYAKAA